MMGGGVYPKSDGHCDHLPAATKRDIEVIRTGRCWFTWNSYGYVRINSFPYFKWGVTKTNQVNAVNSPITVRLRGCVYSEGGLLAPSLDQFGTACTKTAIRPARVPAKAVPWFIRTNVRTIDHGPCDCEGDEEDDATEPGPGSVSGD